jgi:hypothetical protein
MMWNTARTRQLNWKHELIPVIAVAGLIADYVSPAATWTILLPLAAVVALIALRARVAAALVFLLSSWVLIPVAAHTVTTVENMRGQHRLYLFEDTVSLNRDEMLVFPDVPLQADFAVLPLGPGHLLQPRGPMLRAIETFANVHNAMVIDAMVRDGALDGDRPLSAWDLPAHE